MDNNQQRERLAINIIKLPHGEDLATPKQATLGSAGMDLLAAITEDIIIKAGTVEIIPTGIAISLPLGYEGQVRPRSGLAAKHGITVLNSPGTIDADYRGEIKAILINHSKEDFTISRGMRVAQLVIAKHETVDLIAVTSLDETDRGSKGFGSTGC
ncbi:MAG: dUTP diphosphatase [Rickettsiaceae bacterium]|nr:dUTP diphosphatase [Rickettsiaceae bacterium]